MVEVVVHIAHSIDGLIADRDGSVDWLKPYETEDYVAVMGLIAEGLGIALVPDLILRTVQHDDVVALPIKPPSMRRIEAVTTPDLQRVPAVRATLDALLQSAAAQPKPVRRGR